MRYYDIQAGDLRYTSLGANGVANPGALNVEMNISVAPQGAPNPGSWVRVWGMGLQDISQAKDLVNKPIAVKGGMSKGLPLANPAEAGPLTKGIIYQAFGNWVGTDQTLDFIITASHPAPDKGGPDPKPKTTPIILEWRKGTQLKDAIQKALSTAFPQAQINMAIGSNYKAPSDQIGFHGALDQFAHYIRRYSQMLAGAGSEGVGIHFFNGDIFVHDGSQPQQGGTINYQDLIGQPTWIGVDRISIKLVMRGDLNVGQTIVLPKTLVTGTPGAGHAVSGSTSPQETLTFQGSFQIATINHLGNFRQPDAASWVTVVEANTLSGDSGSGGSSGGSTGSGGIGSDSVAAGTSIPSGTPLGGGIGRN